MMITQGNLITITVGASVILLALKVPSKIEADYILTFLLPVYREK